MEKVKLSRESIENIASLRGFCHDNGFDVVLLEIDEEKGEYIASSGDCMVSIKLLDGKFYAVGYCCSCMDQVEVDIESGFNYEDLVYKFVYHC